MSNKVRNTLITACFLGAGSLFIYAAVKFFLKRPKMAASPEVWIARAQNPKTGKKLNFEEFPLKERWTKVCLFQGHSTDAEFASIVPYKSEWKLSDKSKSTTQKDHLAVVFLNDDTQKIVHFFDVSEKQIRFDKSLYQQCILSRNAQLQRAEEATEHTGPLFK